MGQKNISLVAISLEKCDEKFINKIKEVNNSDC